jgi:1,4-alpha-glucan branching enzyme
MFSRGLPAALLLTLLACEPGASPGQSAAELGKSGGPLGSQRPGMGAVVYPGGTMFRVWAPNASAAFVAGDFNGWSDSATPLWSESNGNWSADVAGAIAGQKYKLVLHHGSDVLHRADPRAAQMENSAGASIIHDPAAYAWQAQRFVQPGLNESVIYELHVGAFNPTTPGRPGTWRSAIDKLAYLADLGINVIELMPVAEFPSDFSWGYEGSYPFAPSHTYGSPEEMKSFVDAAHGLGIAVVLDVVHAHYGPNDLSMWQFDGETFGAGGIYFYSDWRAHTPWGNTRPDYGRPQVRDFIVDNTRSWLDEYRLDGLRWDATMEIRSENGVDIPDGFRVLQLANDAVRLRWPSKLMIAEDFRDDASLTMDTASGGAGFSSQWDGAFFHPVADNVILPDDGARDMAAVAFAIGHQFNGQASQRVIYTETHDEVANGRQRVPEMIWPGNAGSWASRKRSTLGAAIALTSPGIPMLFMGQEFVEDGYFAAERPLDWGKLNRFGGIHDLYRDLIYLRRNWRNNTRGLRGDHVNVFRTDESSKVIAYHRWDLGGPGDDVVVVANFSGQGFPSYTLGFPRSGTWRLRFNSDYAGYAQDFGSVLAADAGATRGKKDGLPASATIGIGPYSLLIFSQ